MKFGTGIKSRIPVDTYDDLDEALEASGVGEALERVYKPDREREKGYARNAGGPYYVTKDDRPKLLFVYTVPGEGIKLLNECSAWGSCIDSYPFTEVEITDEEILLSDYGLDRSWSARKAIASRGAIVTRVF